jgi:hypothetical protein
MLLNLHALLTNNTLQHSDFSTRHDSSLWGDKNQVFFFFLSLYIMQMKYCSTGPTKVTTKARQQKTLKKILRNRIYLLSSV